MVSSDDIKKLGKLAHLQISQEEEAELIQKLSAIIAHVDQLKSVDVSAVEPMSHVHGSTNVFRADSPAPGLSIEDLMKNVPDHSGRFIRVPLIVE
jgi:aspartyl-tRNA(Asn)/glutamyl-tRNA(Gln) amidotransferase subunit C